MKFKNLLTLLTLTLTFALSGFSQEKVAEALSSDRFETAMKKGVFTFQLPEGITQKDVAVSADFYTMYFSVDFDEKKKLATLTLKDKETRTLFVMSRFFVSLEIREMKYKDDVFLVQDFYPNYLKVLDTNAK